MGVIDNAPQRKWYQPHKGKIIRIVKEPTERAVPYTYTPQGSSESKTRLQEEYRGVSGFIVGMQLREKKDMNTGEVNPRGEWVLTLLDRDGDGPAEPFYLSLNYASGYAWRLINALAAVPSFESQVLLEAWSFVPDGFEHAVAGITLSVVDPITAQAKKVDGRFKTTELPPVKEIILRGKKEVDNTERLFFIEQLALNQVIPSIRATAPKVYALFGLQVPQQQPVQLPAHQEPAPALPPSVGPTSYPPNVGPTSYPPNVGPASYTPPVAPAQPQVASFGGPQPHPMNPYARAVSTPPVQQPDFEPGDSYEDPN